MHHRSVPLTLVESPGALCKISWEQKFIKIQDQLYRVKPKILIDMILPLMVAENRSL